MQRYGNRVLILKTYFQKWKDYNWYLEGHYFEVEGPSTLFTEGKTYKLQYLYQSDTKRIGSFILWKAYWKKKSHDLDIWWCQLLYVQNHYQIKTANRSNLHRLASSVTQSQPYQNFLAYYQNMRQCSLSSNSFSWQNENSYLRRME